MNTHEALGETARAPTHLGRGLLSQGRVAAHVDVALGVAEERPHLFMLLADQLLNISLAGWEGAGVMETSIEGDDEKGGEPTQEGGRC